MCIVTFIPNSKKNHLTFNRDEKSNRKTIPLQLYTLKKKEYYFPKDALYGGTWFIYQKNKKAMCLLNGAYFPYVEKKFKQSRGQILMQHALSDNTTLLFDKIDLTNVAPFTMLEFNLKKENSLKEYIWDGEKKNKRTIDCNTPMIWVSATLYNQNIKEKFKSKFENWILENKNPNEEQLKLLHTTIFKQEEESENFIKKDKLLRTVSIINFNHYSEKSTINYIDIINKKEYKKIV